MLPAKNYLDSREPVFTGLKIAAVSLGCSKNRIDTEQILGLLLKWGCVLTEDYGSADVIIVNTCSFIEDAQQESIDTLLQMAAKYPGKSPKIVAAGCLVEVFGSKVINSMIEVDGAIGVHSYNKLERFMRMLLDNKRLVIKDPAPKDFKSLAPRVLTTPSHSAAVKIAEGCSNRCSYCLIPGIRGPYRSRLPEEIIAEIDELTKRKTKEINLIAQDTTAYGTDLKGSVDLAGLIRQILSIKRKFWLRIMYTYPSHITEELIDIIASEPRVCNYLDVPIQHSNERVLKLMGRKYGRDDLTSLFKNLRTRIPTLTLRTTCMVGYPTESRQEFNELLRFTEEQRFEKLGVFSYSPQDGTEATCMSNMIKKRVSKKRNHILMLNQQRIAHEIALKQIGKEMVVLVDRVPGDGSVWHYGRTEYQAPDIDGGVYFRSKKILKPGDWTAVKICAASPYNLMAVAI